MSKVCVVIPTYNEAENLPKLIGALEETLQERDFKIILVDDNSPDGTANIAEELNRHYRNIIVHSRPCKFGIGSAIRDGFKIALSFPECKHIVTMDADLSHDPKDVLYLLSEAENADLIQGSRYVKGGKIIGCDSFRRAASYMANILCMLMLKTHLHEHTTYFRVYSRKCVETIVASVHCGQYEFAIDSILVAKRNNFRIKEVPITFVNRARGRSKLKASNVLAWFLFFMKMLLLQKLRRAR